MAGSVTGGALVNPAAADGLCDLVAGWAGGPSPAACLGTVATSGTVVLGPGNTEKTQISIYDFFGHEGARGWSAACPAHIRNPRPRPHTLARLVAAGRLDPAVDLTLTWTTPALTAPAERRISGKAVPTVG